VINNVDDGRSVDLASRHLRSTAQRRYWWLY